MSRKLLYLLAIALVVKTSGCAQDKKPAEKVSPDIQKVISFPVPDKIVFAGEEVPLNDPETRERLEKEIIQNCYKHSSTLLILKRSGRWKQKVQEILKEQGIPEDFYYIAAIESDLDPYADSNKARGFWQFTDTTAKDFNLEVSNYVDMRVDPIASTYAACKYFKRAYAEFSNWTLAAASFNPGITAVKKVKQMQGVDSYYDLYFSPETYRYVFRVIALKVISENPGTYGFYLSEKDLYQPLAGKIVKVDSTIPDLAKFTLEHGINFKILKRYNPWIKYNRYDYRFEVLPGKSYNFLLPE